MNLIFLITNIVSIKAIEVIPQISVDPLWPFESQNEGNSSTV
jgi:hypothetical protein